MNNEEQKQGWRSMLDARQQKEIEFCIAYINDFNHGTNGHLEKGLIARLSLYLDILAQEVDIKEIVTRKLLVNDLTAHMR